MNSTNTSLPPGSSNMFFRRRCAYFGIYSATLHLLQMEMDPVVDPHDRTRTAINVLLWMPRAGGWQLKFISFFHSHKTINSRR